MLPLTGNPSNKNLCNSDNFVKLRLVTAGVFNIVQRARSQPLHLLWAELANHFGRVPFRINFRCN